MRHQGRGRRSRPFVSRSVSVIAATPQDVLDFWFVQSSQEDWFKGGPAFDDRCRAMLQTPYEQARDGKLDDWPVRYGADGVLALLILLDQVPRNLFREDGRAYATDAKALALAEAAISACRDLAFDADGQRLFFYLPLEHAEDLAAQDRCCALMAERLKDPEFLVWAEKHRDVIRRFGRFPHRNAVLGRTTTPEEAAYMAEHGRGF